jgi:hypothetical protein
MLLATQVRRPVMETVIERYDQAWNAPDAESRSSLLETALSDDCELIEPNGRFVGREEILERITGFADRFPAATVKIVTNVDAHNGFARYGWEIVDADGNLVLEGIDVVETSRDGKIRRILMFFGTLSTT